MKSIEHTPKTVSKKKAVATVVETPKEQETPKEEEVVNIFWLNYKSTV